MVFGRQFLAVHVDGEARSGVVAADRLDGGAGRGGSRYRRIIGLALDGDVSGGGTLLDAFSGRVDGVREVVQPINSGWRIFNAAGIPVELVAESPGALVVGPLLKFELLDLGG